MGMDSTQVREPQPGTPGQGTDVGAHDLEQRLNGRIEQTASGFRQIVDKRFSVVDNLARDYATTKQQLGQMQQALGQIQGYFQQAKEAEMDPDERAKLQSERTQLAMAREREALIKNARQQNAAFTVARALPDLGMKWGDERIDWGAEAPLYESDPNTWANNIILRANQAFAQEATKQTQQRATETQRTVETRAQESAQAARVEAQNAQRQMAAGVSPAQPSGEGPDWRGRVDQMGHKERLEYIQRVKNKLLHGEISHPNQVM